MNKHRMYFAAFTVGIALILGGCDLNKSSQAPDDSAITAEIQSKLYQDPTLKTLDVHVASQKGVVVLTGAVNSPEQKSAVEHLAQGADGVKQVFDDITVSPSTASIAETPQPVRESARSQRYHAARHSGRTMASDESDDSEATPVRAPTASASSPAPPPAAAPASPPPPPQPVRVTIPAGTVVSVQLIDGVDTSVNHVGDEFAASVASPVMQGGQVIIPQNADARVSLVNATSAGKIKGRSTVELQLVSVSVGGRNYSVTSDPYEQSGGSRGKRSAEVIGGGAGLGALLGGIFGGGKGAAIGAAAGAGGGTAVQVATKGQQVKIPSETRLDFTLQSPVTITLHSGSSEAPTQEGGADTTQNNY